ncbi:thiamine-phosphate pyrophosphorylase [Pedobacter westerhofensis]|uniref:Thiamine-phosphate pyrophosphorylase n=1 Tax=Pedobacter westerhofensis TaxID=425512 RepID=A0A521EVR3_9SPHI|nr:thiamine phosphate synthase [Pedobacter westerhofensis]SMO88016.1 thiamine-phosphate pyrophosphorylase [Pedobacter westerhofensis]
MELIVVTPPDYFEGEAALINQFFAEGLRLLHIRKTADDPAQFRLLMKDIDPEYHPLISIHQHHELAEEFDIARLHFKEQRRRELSSADIEHLLDAGFYLSTSVHELSVITELSSFGYVFYGPVFDSISKPGYHAVQGDGFVLPRMPAKVFAIGGVEAKKLGQLKKMKFDGAAVLGSFWHHEISPLAALKELLSKIEEHHNEPANEE